MFEPQLLVSLGGTIWLMLGGIVFAKVFSIFLLATTFGLNTRDALRTGLTLAHVGEFGLLLVGAGLRERLIPEETGQLLIATATVGFLAGSILARHDDRIASSVLRLTRAPAPIPGTGPALVQKGTKLAGHVLVCGYGRVGQSVARILERRGIEWIALDLDPKRVVDAHRGGEPVFLADAAVPDALRSAGLARAEGVVVTFDDPRAAERVAETIRGDRGATIPLVVRIRDEEAVDRLLRAGATWVLPVALEASLGLATELLIALGHSPAEAAYLAQQIRRERYASLRTYYPGQADAEPTDEDSRPRHRHSWTVPRDSDMVGRELTEIDPSPASLILRLRGDRRLGEEEPVEAGDVLVLEGSREDIAAATDRLGLSAR